MILCIAHAAVVAATSAVSVTIAAPAPAVGDPSPAALVVAHAAVAAVPAAVHVATISTAPATAYPRSISTCLSLPSLRLYFSLAASKRSFCCLILIWLSRLASSSLSYMAIDGQGRLLLFVCLLCIKFRLLYFILCNTYAPPNLTLIAI